MNTVIVIGAGASGLAASIAAAVNGSKVILLEASSSPAAKLLSTGGGKCNYSNMNMGESFYNSESRSLIKAVLNRFDSADAVSFFESIGVFSIDRDGYLYPRSEDASTVRDALLEKCEHLGVKLHTNTAALTAVKSDNKFFVNTGSFTYEGDKLIIASGGSAGGFEYPGGYGIAKSFGHEITPLRSALSGVLFRDRLNSCAGIRTHGLVSYTDESGITFSGEGEIQLTNYGASGIPVMNLSRILGTGNTEPAGKQIVFDFIPEYSREDFDKVIFGGASLSGFFPKKFAGVFDLSSDVKHPKHYVVDVDGVRGLDHAQVCAGGVKTDYVDGNMQSMLTDGLYFAGEILDVDGICGGYNLHFAWASGIIAGCASAGTGYKSIVSDKISLLKRVSVRSGSRRSNTGIIVK